MKYRVFAISDNGDGRVEELQGWDGVDALEIHLNVFARDAVISIEENREEWGKEVED